MKQQKVFLAVFGAVLVTLFVGTSLQAADNSSKFFRENLAVLVTRASIDHVNQVEVLGYYPDALFTFYKPLLVGGGSNAKMSPSKLLLEEEDTETSTTMNFQSGEKGNFDFHLPTGAFIDKLRASLGKRQIALEDDLFYYPRQPEVLIRSFLDATRVDQLPFLRGRATKDKDQTNVVFGAAPTSTKVFFANQKRMKELVDGYTGSYLAPDEKAEAVTKDRLQAAWQKSAALYREHFRTAPLTLKLKYEGPNAEGDEVVIGNFLLLTQASQTEGHLVTANLAKPKPPALAAEGAKEPEVRTAQVRVRNAKWKADDAKVLEKVELDAAKLLETIVLPAIAREGKAKSLKVYAKNGVQSGVVTSETEGTWIQLAAGVADGHEIMLTDESDTHVWTLRLSLEEKPFAPTGNFLPVRDRAGLAKAAEKK